MWQDPIIAEIHQTRDQISQAHGNDMHAIFVAAQRGELAKSLVSLESMPDQQGTPADPRAAALLQREVG